jgi:hypothetical protein
MAAPAWVPIANWKTRGGVHPARPDPYVVWAQVTNFADYPEAQWTPPPLPWHCRMIRWIFNLVGLLWLLPECPKPPDPAVRRAVIIELDSIANLGNFIVAAASHADDIAIGALYGMTLKSGLTTPPYGKYLTAFVTLEGLRLLANPAAPAPGQFVVRFDLCEYISPRRPIDVVDRSGFMGPDDPPPLVGDQLLGIIDDGCPFAHSSFLVPHPRPVPPPTLAPTTRFASLWDQNPIRPAFAPTSGPPRYGAAPWPFVNGWEIRRGSSTILDLTSTTPGATINTKGLNDWLALFYASATGTIDEEACYDLANYDMMKRTVVHGPHVADVAAGPLRWRQTIYTDRDTPPGEDPTPITAIDCAKDPTVTDIAWVQLPRGGLQDSSGGWLDSHVLDGVRYLLWCRGAATNKTVITLSYGSTVGPHDGSSILANALDAIVAAEEGPKCDSLHIVMAGGNSFDARGHALLDLYAGQAGTLVWRVLPGSEAPSFLQLWLPDKAWRVSLTAPGGASTGLLAAQNVSVWPTAASPSATVVYVEAGSRGGSPMVLMALAPTVIDDTPSREPAPHGDWIVTVQAGATDGVARAYIARNDVDMDAVLRGRQSIFVDPADSPAPELREPLDDENRNPWDTALFGAGARAGAVLRRRGTLNGIATSPGPKPVAGHCRNYSDAGGDRTHAIYSSAGQAPDNTGRNPFTSYPTDESPVLQGVRAAGSRSGSMFRLVGTSTAAPQLARWLLMKGPKPVTKDYNDPAIFGTDGGRPAIFF